MSATFTRGPWTLGHSGFERKPSIIGRGITGAPFRIASVTEEDDARLIAAAPELYEALRLVYRSGGKLSHMEWQQVESALAKVRGDA